MTPRKSSLDDLLEGTSEAPRVRLSWRPPAELSDWELVVGSKTYRVHKAIVGAGERRSVMLRDMFEHRTNLPDGGVGGQTASTNLSSGDSPYVPPACAKYFEEVLDFMYTGQIELRAANAVHICYMARTLQCVALLHRIKDFLETAIEKDGAPGILRDALKLPAETGPISDRCVEVIGASLSEYALETMTELAELPVEVIEGILEATVAAAPTPAQGVAAFHRARGFSRRTENTMTGAISYLVLISICQRVNPKLPRYGSETGSDAYATLVPFVKEVRKEDVAFMLQFVLAFDSPSSCVPFKVPALTYNDAKTVLPMAIRTNHDGVLKLCTPVFAEKVDDSKVADLVALQSHDTVVRILDSDALRLNEDKIFNIITEYIELSPVRDQATVLKLWTCCRFAFCSPSKIAIAALDSCVPAKELRLAMSFRIFQEASRRHGNDEKTSGEKQAEKDMEAFKRSLPHNHQRLITSRKGGGWFASVFG